MPRRLTTFACAGETLHATLDEATATTGLLIVSGGNELRIGAHRGMASLAQRIAAQGYPVFRFDRRGIGDSTGTNNGFLSAGDDLRSAVAAFRREAPQIREIMGFGNCDGATTLALFHASGGIDRLVLANLWLVDAQAGTPPPAAIRSRYASRLADPRQLLRLLRGEIDLRKLTAGIRAILPRKPNGGLAARVAAALAGSSTPATLLLARQDNTALACADAWRSAAFAPVRTRIPLLLCDTASHSFARSEDANWLETRLLEALRSAG